MLAMSTISVLYNQAIMLLKHTRYKNLFLIAPEILGDFYAESYLGKINFEILRLFVPISIQLTLVTFVTIPKN